MTNKELDALVGGWDDLKENLPSDGHSAAEMLFDYGDKLADTITAIPAATAHPVAVTVKPLVDALREAFNILEDALQEAGDDYPGSKMQEWCQQQVQHARQIRDAALRSITEDNA